MGLSFAQSNTDQEFGIGVTESVCLPWRVGAAGSRGIRRGTGQSTKHIIKGCVLDNNTRLCNVQTLKSLFNFNAGVPA